jgi:hypothetical protein
MHPPIKFAARGIVGGHSAVYAAVGYKALRLLRSSGLSWIKTRRSNDHLAPSQGENTECRYRRRR